MKEMGIGSRVINFLVDTLIVFLVSYGLYKWHNFYVRYWGHKFVPAWMFFAAFLIVYYTTLESTTGRTIGKYLSLTKVKTTEWKKPGVLQVLLRSLLRLTLVDAFLIPVLGRPLHDSLSNTRVVEV